MFATLSFRLVSSDNFLPVFDLLILSLVSCETIFSWFSFPPFDSFLRIPVPLSFLPNRRMNSVSSLYASSSVRFCRK